MVSLCTGVTVGEGVGVNVGVGEFVGVITLVGTRVGVGVRVGFGVQVGSNFFVGIGVEVGYTRIGTGVFVGVDTTCCTGALLEVDPPHITMLEYEQEDPVQPSLQMTLPFDCGPAPQLTPLCPLQHPDVAKAGCTITKNRTRKNSLKMSLFIFAIIFLFSS